MTLKRGKTRLPHKLIYLTAVALFITIVFALSTMESRTPKNTSSVDPAVRAREALGLAVESFLETRPEVTPYLDLETQWNKTGQDLVDEYTLVNFTKSHWNATIICKTTPDLAYQVNMEHREGIIWVGTVKEGRVTEKEYMPPNKTKSEGIKDTVMMFIVENHPEAAEYVEDPSGMEWRLTDSVIKIGYSEYTYTCDDWEITIGYAITAPEYKAYEVQLENSEHGIKWTGIVTDSGVTETSYEAER